MPIACNKNERLINALMDFLADFPACRNAHQHHLAVLAGGHLVTEVFVTLR